MTEKDLTAAEWNTLFNMVVSSSITCIIPVRIETELLRRGYVEKVGACCVLSLMGRQFLGTRLAECKLIVLGIPHSDSSRRERACMSATTLVEPKRTCACLDADPCD